ncbi:MAG: aminotransferase class III-fold pyridoxal phosphate-dependent enzyme [SAR202 cluster bacterium]|nr:aminotransferase class III-fold pyridoxal phosphate-dependent enzyme [SAR202 cluster bacterium]
MSTAKAYRREEERHFARTSKSRRLAEEAKKYLPGGNTRAAAWLDPYPVFAVRGQGAHIYDADGNKYLDFLINATSLILGHAHPAVVSALQEQATMGTAFANPTESQVRLAKMLCERVPSVERVRFTNSGTEATINAIRAARAYTGRPKIAKFEGTYHGVYDYVSVSVKPPLDKAGRKNAPKAVAGDPSVTASVVKDVVILPFNDLESSEKILRKHAHELSCVIMEPIVSMLGYVVGDLEFLQGIRRITEELEIVLIYDEVQSLRLGRGGAQEMYGVRPDLSTFGKTIGGGLPVGAFGGKKEIMALFDPSEGNAALPHAGTFNANPMTMVAGATVLEHLTPGIYKRLNSLGDRARQKLQATFDEMDVPAKLTGVGSLYGIHFTDKPVKDYRDAARADQELRKCLVLGLQNEGVILYERATGAIAVPHSDDDVDLLVEATRKVIQRARG